MCFTVYSCQSIESSHFICSPRICTAVRTTNVTFTALLQISFTVHTLFWGSSAESRPQNGGTSRNVWYCSRGSGVCFHLFHVPGISHVFCSLMLPRFQWGTHALPVFNQSLHFGYSVSFLLSAGVVCACVGYLYRSCICACVGYLYRSCIGACVGYLYRSCICACVGYLYHSSICACVRYLYCSCVSGAAHGSPQTGTMLHKTDHLYVRVTGCLFFFF